jgi:hypothetical protein
LIQAEADAEEEIPTTFLLFHVLFENSTTLSTPCSYTPKLLNLEHIALPSHPFLYPAEQTHPSCFAFSYTPCIRFFEVFEASTSMEERSGSMPGKN